MSQLSGRPALVDAYAEGPVDALIIPPAKLRALLVAEADLGERIMRALILRRVGLIEAGVGPIIVGDADHGDVLRLENFLRRNGQPHRRLDPDTDADARALLQRFHVERDELPIVLCPGGQLLRNPAEAQLARVAQARGVGPEQIRSLMAAHSQDPDLGFLGEPRVNVLTLNIALDERFPKK